MSKYFDWNRFVRLAKFDYVQRKWFYWGLLPLMFALVSLVHLVIWNLFRFQSESIPTNNLKIFFFVGLIIATLVISGNSFKEFYKKEISLQFLMIPASNFEKYLLKLLMGILPVVLFYPLVYDLAVEFSIWLTVLFKKLIWGRLVTVEEYMPIVQLGKAFTNPIDGPWWGPISIITFWLFFPLYFFTGGLLYSKRPKIYSFITLISFVVLLIMFISFFSVSLKTPVPFLLSYPELTEGSPMSSSSFIMLIFFWLTIPAMLVLSYFKLKEKEV